jgi:predicted nucleic acid-binding protein
VTSAIVNSSPLIHLGDARRITLLRDLFDTVFVPDAVSREILAKGERDVAAVELKHSPWIQRVAVDNIPAEVLAWDIGAGEGAVLAYALQNPGAEAIIDDLAARRCAKVLNIPVCGTVGLVLRAARKRVVRDPVRLLNELRDAGMWISPALFVEVINIAREYE